MGTSSADGPIAFPSTLWSEVIAARDPADPRWRDRMNRLILRYWRPVYWSLRLRWKKDPEEAKDLTQEFFIEVLDGRAVSTADPQLGSFRHYLKRSLDFFVSNEARARYTHKRGGDRERLTIDFGDGECPGELADASLDPATLFDRAWAHQTMGEAVQELLAELGAAGLPREAEVFRAVHLAAGGKSPSGRELAERLGVSKTEVWKSLAEARRRLRRILLRKVSEYVHSEADLSREFDDLFSG